jgi:hypothetical protein
VHQRGDRRGRLGVLAGLAQLVEPGLGPEAGLGDGAVAVDDQHAGPVVVEDLGGRPADEDPGPEAHGQSP